MSKNIKKVVIAETNQAAAQISKEVEKILTKSNESAESSHRRVMAVVDSSNVQTESNESAQNSSSRVDDILNEKDT